MSAFSAESAESADCDPMLAHYAHFLEQGLINWEETPEKDEFMYTAAAVVTRLIQHGSWLTQAVESHLPKEAKEQVEKDVTSQIENFLRSMATDPNGSFNI